MSRLIVHTGTDTILDAAECVLVDTDLFDDHDMARLSGDDYFDDGVVVEIAERCGVAVNTHEQILRAISGVIAAHCDYDDDTSDGELLDIVFELLDEAGLTVGSDEIQTHFMNDLRRDAARWNAFIGGKSTNRAQLRVLLETFICPSCDSAGDHRSLVSPLTASVVPWDVMGDSRSFAFVCDECASGSAVVL